ncbi:hypothetical protein DHD32_10945 [Arenibacter sp. TNZ]|uniref:hypothetical protein n=1 Tax=Arenibacter TaxID=178469 RepID=UPI000CD43C77|nr:MULTISPECIES: hypothetical protein [Arenibacter]MCM4171999.1 hypothetical protein [Arenibacter sp. TNZ]
MKIPFITKIPFFLIAAIFLLNGCSEDDNIDCALFDPAFPSLFLKLIDASGNNLIELGTIDPNAIRVDGEFPNAGFIFIPANEFAVPDTDIRKLDNTIQLFIPTESHYQYSIHLSDSDSLLVDFSAKLTRIPCGLSYFLPTGVVVKNVEFEFTELSPLQFLVVIKL